MTNNHKEVLAKGSVRTQDENGLFMNVFAVRGENLSNGTSTGTWDNPDGSDST